MSFQNFAAAKRAINGEKSKGFKHLVWAVQHAGCQGSRKAIDADKNAPQDWHAVLRDEAMERLAYLARRAKQFHEEIEVSEHVGSATDRQIALVEREIRRCLKANQTPI